MLNKTMRDTFFDHLYEAMNKNERIFFLTVDFGAPMLDKIRKEFPQRSINVGVAEQNAINVATGLALEKYIVYVYGIAPFVSMRPFEQLRVNLAALSQLRRLNVNIISVGAGISYTMSGPTHHCLEDLSIIKTLPNFELFSPSDSVLVEKYFHHTLEAQTPKYLRFDVQNLPPLSSKEFDIKEGFRLLHQGTNSKLTLISTGFMSQKAEKLAQKYDITAIDLFSLNAYDKDRLIKLLKDTQNIITLEEGFSASGGLDSEINFYIKGKNIINMGFPKQYTFELGDREFIHSLNNLGTKDIEKNIEELLRC